MAKKRVNYVLATNKQSRPVKSENPKVPGRPRDQPPLQIVK